MSFQASWTANRCEELFSYDRPFFKPGQQKFSPSKGSLEKKKLVKMHRISR